MPIRRCSGVSTRNSPPKLHQACPPRLASLSWSSSTTDRPGVGELARGDEAGEARLPRRRHRHPWADPMPRPAGRDPLDRHLEVADTSGTTRSATASSSSRGVVPRTATRARHPASRAARSPATESSTTTHSPGSTPSRRAPSSHGSGHGLPRVTSDAVTTTGGCGSRVAAMRASARSCVPTSRWPWGRHRRRAPEQVGGPRQHDDAVDVGDLEVEDAVEAPPRGRPRAGARR